MKTSAALACALLDMAKQGGAAQAEVFERASRTLVADARKAAMEAIETSDTFGYCIRLIKDGRAGFSYSNDPAEASRVVLDALDSARYTEPDEYLTIYHPEGAPAPDAKTFDPDIEAVTGNQALELACRVEAACVGADKRMTKVRKSSVSFASSETLIANSWGLMTSYASTGASASITAVAEKGGESRMGWEYQGSRRLGNMDFEAVGRDAARHAVELLGAKNIAACKAPVLLDRAVAVDFLGVFASMLSSEAVQKGKSLLKGRIGQQVLGPAINIIDDALMPDASGLRPMDDEGVPVRRNVLIKEGVLESYLYNTHTAARDGRKSTGNAVRGGHMTPPSVGALSLFISGHTYTVAELLARMGSGLLVTDVMGMHTADAISGDFSVGASGLWIEGGRVAHPVKEAVISGNLLDFFGAVAGLGDDLRFYGRLGSPSILFGPTDISG